MTNRTTLEALLARVLEGAGPDRELDAEIEACLTGRVTHPRNPGWTFEPQDAEWKLARLANSPFISHASRPAPHYTASLDAALTLVPDGWSWHVALRKWPTPTRATGSVWSESLDGTKLFYVEATTPARALIAACLKARIEP